MGLFGEIFSSKTVDGVMKGVDMAVFTPEEKVKYHLDFLKAYEPFKLAQRILAFAVIIPYIGIYIISSFLMVYGIFTSNQLALESAQFLATNNNENLGVPTAIIMAWYFAGGVIKPSLLQKKKD